MDYRMSKTISKIVKALTEKKRCGKAHADDDAYDVPYDKNYYRRGQIPLPLDPTSDIISQLPCFHPQLRSKEDVQKFMSQYSLQDGYFIIRRSFKDPNSYIITVNHRSGLKHIEVITIENRFSLKDKTFDTFDELMQFYSHREIPNKENVTGILLKFPIRRPIIDFGEYIQVDELKVNKSSSETQPTEPVQSNHPSNNIKKHESQTGHQPDANVSFRQTPTPPPRTGKPKSRSSVPTSPEEESIDRCDCGLSLKESTLPMGWSVHVRQDEEMGDQMFFMSPEQVTHWELPMAVCLLLTSEQQNFIRNLQKDAVSRTWVSWST